MAKFDLNLAAAARLTRGPIVFAPIFPPQGLVTALEAIMVAPVKAWRTILVRDILPTYTASLRSLAQTRDGFTKDAVEDIASIVGTSDATISRLILTLTPQLADWIVRAERIHRSQFVAAVKTAAGVNLDTIIGPEGAQTTMRATYEENLSLIRNVSEDMRTRIGRIVFNGFQQRTPRREVAKALNDALGIGRRRALLIASDQTTKLSARLDQERQEEIGITRFRWRHSGKVHYRPHHKARDGKVYSWRKNNLGGDLPGVAINCGCKAQGYVAD